MKLLESLVVISDYIESISPLINILASITLFIYIYHRYIHTDSDECGEYDELSSYDYESKSSSSKLSDATSKLSPIDSNPFELFYKKHGQQVIPEDSNRKENKYEYSEDKTSRSFITLDTKTCPYIHDNFILMDDPNRSEMYEVFYNMNKFVQGVAERCLSAYINKKTSIDGSDFHPDVYEIDNYEVLVYSLSIPPTELDYFPTEVKAHRNYIPITDILLKNHIRVVIRSNDKSLFKTCLDVELHPSYILVSCFRPGKWMNTFLEGSYNSESESVSKHKQYTNYIDSILNPDEFRFHYSPLNQIRYQPFDETL